MAISALGKKGLVDVLSKGAVYSDITVAFALDKGYLDCMKVMLTSMASNGILCDSPVAFYTDDKSLFDDPVINLVADKKVVVEGNKKDIIYSLAKNNVKRPEKSDWNRGTFLKWCVFEAQPTQKLLFLDVDMLLLGEVEQLLRGFDDKQIVTCPQFQKSLKEGDVDKKLKDMLAGRFDAKHKKRINSGVMLLSQELLSDSFFEEITRYAGNKVSIHEQGHLSDFFSARQELLGMAPSRFNYQDSYLRLASSDSYHSILDEISILHYAGGVKPWSPGAEPFLNLASIDIWHQYKRLANEVLKYN